MADFDMLLEQFRLARREGRTADARRSAERAAAGARADNDLAAYAKALCAVATCARDRRDAASAERCYSEAIDVYGTVGNRDREIHALRHRGDVFAETGRLERAMAIYDEVLAGYDALPHAAPLDVANAFRSFAICREHLQHPAEALDAWTRALALYERAGVAAGVEESSERVKALGAAAPRP